MSDRPRASRRSLGKRLQAAASVFMTGAVPGGRYGGLVSAADWNGRFDLFDDASVDEGTALNVSAVSACVSLIADTMSQLPIGVYQRDGERRLPLPDHPVNRLFAGACNDYQGRRALVKVVEGHRQLRGNGYLQVERDEKGTPVGLWPLGNACPKRRDNGELFYETGTGGQRQELSASNVIHVRGLSTDTNGLVGVSPVAAARNAIMLGIYAERFGTQFFKNESKSGGFVTHPGKLSTQASKNIRDAMEDFSKSDGRKQSHRIGVLEEGMKFFPTTIAPEEAQFLASRQFQLEEIARWFRVPLVLIQSTEKTTSWGTGVEQLLIAFSQFTVSPLAQSFEEEFSLKLLTQEERDQGYYVRLDLRGMLRGDSASRAAYYSSGIQNRWLLPNEARAKEDLDPLPGGDAFEAKASEPRQPIIE